jgi:hypothetical protein
MRVYMKLVRTMGLVIKFATPRIFFLSGVKCFHIATFINTFGLFLMRKCKVMLITSSYIKGGIKILLMSDLTEKRTVIPLCGNCKRQRERETISK